MSQSKGHSLNASAPISRRSRVARFLRVWAPLGVWLVVIGFTSGELGARTHIDVWVWHVMNEWLPGLLGIEPSTTTPSFLPWWVRKLAHVGEYMVLGLVAVRAWNLRASDRGRRRAALAPAPADGGGSAAAGLAAHLTSTRGRSRFLLPPLALSAAVATLDELHQSTLPARTGSPRDVAIDLCGALMGIAIGARLWRATFGGARSTEAEPPAHAPTGAAAETTGAGGRLVED